MSSTSCRKKRQKSKDGWQNAGQVHKKEDQSKESNELQDHRQGFIAAARNGDSDGLAAIWLWTDGLPDLGGVDEAGNSALHLATQASSLECVSFLLDKTADVLSKNRKGETPIFVVSTTGNVAVCEKLLTTFKDKYPDGANVLSHSILDCNADGVCAVSKSVKCQHLCITKTLLGVCLTQHLITYFTTTIQKAYHTTKTESQMKCSDLLLCLSVVFVTLEERLQAEVLCGAETVQLILKIVEEQELDIMSTSSAYLLLTLILWRGELPGLDRHNTLSGEQISQTLREDCVNMFLECQGPENIVKQMSHMIDKKKGNDNELRMCLTLLPLGVLLVLKAGRDWLQSHRAIIAYCKDSLIRLRGNPEFKKVTQYFQKIELKLGQVSDQLLILIKDMETKCTDQNVAEVLPGEERDQVKREKKKRKKLKKQSKQVLKTSLSMPAMGECSSEEDMEANSTHSGTVEMAHWTQNDYSRSDGRVLSGSEDMSFLEHRYCSVDNILEAGSQLQSSMYGRSTVSSVAPVGSNQYLGTEGNQKVSGGASDDFPPISRFSEEKTSADTNEGWTKVEGRKQTQKTVASRRIQVSDSVQNVTLSNVVSTSRSGSSDPGKLGPMRWADVAKIGCPRDSAQRTLAVLLGNEGTKLLAHQGQTLDVCKKDSETFDRGNWYRMTKSDLKRDNQVSKPDYLEPEDEQGNETDESDSGDSDGFSSSSECVTDGQTGIQNTTTSSMRDLTMATGISSSKESGDIVKAHETHSLFHTADKTRGKNFLLEEHTTKKATSNSGYFGKKETNIGYVGAIRAKSVDRCYNRGPECSPSRDRTKSAVCDTNINQDLTNSSRETEDKIHVKSKLSVKNLNNFSISSGYTSQLSATADSFKGVISSKPIEIFTHSSGPLMTSVIRDPSQIIDAGLDIIYDPEFDKMGDAQESWCESFWDVQNNEIDQSIMDIGEDSYFDSPFTSEPVPSSVTPSTNEWTESSRFMPSLSSMSSILDLNSMLTPMSQSVMPSSFVATSMTKGHSSVAGSMRNSSTRPTAPPGFGNDPPTYSSACTWDPSYFPTGCDTSEMSTLTSDCILTSIASGNSMGLNAQSLLSTRNGLNGESGSSLRTPSSRLTNSIFGAVKSSGHAIGVVGPMGQSACSSGSQLIEHSVGLFSSAISSRASFDGNFGTNTVCSSSPSLLNRVRPSNMSTQNTGKSNLVDLSSLLTNRIQHRLQQFPSQQRHNQFGQPIRYQQIQQQQHQQMLREICQNPFVGSIDSVLKRQFPALNQPKRSPMLQHVHNHSLQQQQQQQHLTPLWLYQQQQHNLLPQRMPKLRSSTNQKLVSSRADHHSGIPSPPVLFPSDLRGDSGDDQSFGERSTLASLSDVAAGDNAPDFISDPQFMEKVAINQIHLQFLNSKLRDAARDSPSSSLRDSVFSSDLDYYASLYKVTIMDVLCPDRCAEISLLGSTADDGLPTRIAPINPSRPDLDLSAGAFQSKIIEENDGNAVISDGEGPKYSRRWRDAINKILGTPWTARVQHGNIILPTSPSDYRIGQSEIPLVLGLTTEGAEVAVLVLDKAQAYIDPCLLDIMCDPDLDHHFILKCKGVSETSHHEYVALELCDYTLGEYVSIVRPSHRQDPLSASRLAWQLLEGLKFIHRHLGMPHGFLTPSWVFVDSEGRLRLGGYGIVTRQSCQIGTGVNGSVAENSTIGRSACWTSTEDLTTDLSEPTMAADVQVAGMLIYFILTGGRHPFGASPLEAEVNIVRSSSQLDHISEEANDLVATMLQADPATRPKIDQCIKHPFFWPGEKKFRLILIVGSDVLTEMKTGVALTGNGALTMMEILTVVDICEVSPNWVQEIHPSVMKEMRSFRVYRNTLSELTLFIYNCCLHFDKMSVVAREVLDDPCKYFQNLFPNLFMAIYRSLAASDRVDRACYKQFF